MAAKIKKILIPVAVVAVAIVAAGSLSSLRKPPEKKEEQRQTILVTAQPIEQQDIVYRIQSQGTVKPRLETSLVSEVNGRIVDVADSFIEGGFFNAGDLLVRVEQADYLTNVKAAEASLANAQAALEEEKARGRVAEEEWRSFTDGTAPELGLRRPQLAGALANVRSAEAELERAKRDLARTEIRAPYAGMVRSRAVNLGQFISRGTSVGVVYGTDIAEVRLPITDNDAGFIQLPQSIDDPVKPEVMLTAVVSGVISQWPARLVRTEGVLDERSRVIYAVAQIEDPYRRNTSGATPLRFGRFVQAQIMGNATSDVVVIPRYLLLAQQQVLVVDTEEQLQFRDVVIERSDEQFAYIRSGFLDSDRLATSAIANPLAGTQVRIAGADNATELAADKDGGAAVLTSQVKE
ncbi:MAG: efflux RND transporter periplasmic adaptor subunit [Gammaproteobacteria bacterium]|nr:efflux RND transporter periplasmic adaptor subunit [Gammaproteobacteria bacterium]MBU1556897.1 efflux RND transporter periplasmic adaptor subunit [Gammaproteobacteria bacterium]MBU2071238.1 efflux RND transporter periplasmic adaptor subunit [Gammaproteobacteria bacterium]MBU2181645.1 efflux RND transporter periplasmic adaptor subunit [Gammaproteobacteria bacterium]MBU2205368.1 efflux RND transporter periplasmic adaptor subunit [Gammaproteobacteria bacterium]